jgi:hypothetical protein
LLARLVTQGEIAVKRLLLASFLFLSVRQPVQAVAPPPVADQWIVVSAPAFRTAIEPLCAARRAQGLLVRVVPVADVLTPMEIRNGEAGKLRDHLHHLCRSHPGRSFVLLVGAVEAANEKQIARIVVPPLRGTVGRMKGQPSDNGYGCPQGGLVPTVAVGRLPVAAEDEAEALVRRILTFEGDDRPGDWKRRLTVLAGIPAYNPVVDRVVENLALSRFDKLSPSWIGKAIYSNPRSRFCVPDRLLRKTALRTVEEGSAFIVYLGHSNAEGLYGGEAPYLDRQDWARLRIGRGAGVFVTFGCNGCQLKGPDGEGYGVSAIRNGNGPVAVLGSHGICFAAMAQLAADGLFRRAFQDDLPERLGLAWLALKTGLAKGSIDPITYRLLDAVDGDSHIPQAVQRQEHLEMFVLLGDPALRLPRLPRDLSVEAGAPTAGHPWTVRGRAPLRLEGARVRVSLERTVSSQPTNPAPLPKDAGPARDAVMLANFEKANTFAVVIGETTIREGRFAVTLKVPDRLSGPNLVVRVHAATEKEEAQVALPCRVGRPAETHHRTP